MNNFYKFLAFLIVATGLFIAVKVLVFSKTPSDEPAKQQSPLEQFKVESPPMPENTTFAGEKVPLNHFDVREGIDRELLVNTYWHSNTIQLIKLAARFFPIIEPILEEEGIPTDFKYVAVVESGLRHPTSYMGAKGMWQFMKETAREYGLEVNYQVDERYNVEASTRAACKFFKKAKNDLGTWTLAAASYNVGRYGVKKQIKRQKQDGFYDLLMNSETQRYIYRIIALKYIMQDPVKYGFNIDVDEMYLPVPTKKLKVDTSVQDFADFAADHNTNYKILKYFNPWLRKAYLKNSGGKTYEITVPKKGMRKWDKIKAQYKSNEKTPEF